MGIGFRFRFRFGDRNGLGFSEQVDVPTLLLCLVFSSGQRAHHEGSEACSKMARTMSSNRMEFTAMLFNN